VTRLGDRCTWKEGQYTPNNDNAVQKWMHQAVTSVPVATGVLKGRKFRILCAYGVAAVHPDDATWVIPGVAHAMKITPIWARATPDVRVSGNLTVPAAYHSLFPWLRATWTCPTCLPTPPYNGWPDCATAPALNRVSTPNENIVAVDGFDSTFMYPWVGNPLAPNTCGAGGPGGDSPPLCIPVRDGQNDNEQQLYLSALWADVGQAVDAVNNGTAPAPAHTFNPGMVAAIKKTVATVQVAPKKSFNPFPLLVAVLAGGLLGIAYRRRRR
jgi:hypothetical protein